MPSPLRPLRACLAAPLVVVALGACGPSVEQARQVTTTLRSEAFTPPPRSAQGVIARLEAPSASRDLAQRLALAAQPPPAGASEAALAQFYLRRARAAALSGRVDRYLDDIRRASRHLDHAIGITRTDARDILRELRAAESQVGRYTWAIDALTRARRLQSSSVVNDILLAELLVGMGDAAGALEAAGRAQARFATQNSPDPSAPNSGVIAAAVAAVAQGRWEEAEAHWRQALELVSLGFSTQVIRSAELGASEDVARARVRVRIAEALRRQGRALEAEVQARDALEAMLGVFGPANLEIVEAVDALALAVLDQGRSADAEALARSALRRLDAMGAPPDAPIRAPVRLTLVRAWLPRRLWARAGRELVALRDALGDNRVLFDRALALDPDVPLILLKSGQADEALARATAGLPTLVTRLGPASVETARMHVVLAMALRPRGRAVEALAAFREALPILLDRGAQPLGSAATGQGADWRLPIFIEGYVALLAERAGAAAARQVGLDATAEAFRVADLARAGGAQRALTANAARAASRTPELADLVRREQDAHAQSLALLGQLAAATLSRVRDQDAGAKPGPDVEIEPAESTRTRRVTEARQKIADLMAARRALRGEIERRFPDYAALVAPHPVRLDEARQALRPGEVLVAFLSGEERTWVWAVPRVGAVLFIAAPLGRDRLAALVATLRQGTALGTVTTLDEVPAFDVAAAHELYRMLLEPVAAAWRGARTLVVAPHGALGLVPISLFVTTPAPARPTTGLRFAQYGAIGWLVRTHAVTTVPSVGSLVAVRRLPAAAGPRPPFVGFGHPQFGARPTPMPPAGVVARGGPVTTRRLGVRGGAPSITLKLAEQLARLQPLPDTAEELRSIARSLGADPERDVFLGRDATEARVKSMDLSRHRVIAFATHALATGELDGLDEPALALSTSTAEPGDGLLTLGEILAFKLDADWIVLSACSTAAGAAEDAEVMSGLGRAAFYAGARALLVSHWAVETSSARLLTTGLFRRQQQTPDLSRAEALRQSMLALIDGPGATDARTGRPLYSYAHPAFWAPFVLVGDGG